MQKVWVWEPERFRFEASPATPWLCHFDSELQNMHLYLEFKKPSQGKELRRWDKPARLHCAGTQQLLSEHTTKLVEAENHTLPSLSPRALVSALAAY